MGSTEILINNLMKYYNVTSLRKLATKLEYSPDKILNWSSHRTSPDIAQVNDIAYKLGVHISELLVINNNFSIDTPIWRDNAQRSLITVLKTKRLECDIHESYFNKSFDSQKTMSYRSFLRYINGKSKNINLRTLDELAEIFNTQTYKLLESENNYEKKEN